MEKDNIKIDIKKYKIFEVKSDLEENYYVFSDNINKVKKWITKNYKDKNPKELSIKYHYSTDNIDKAEEMGKQIL